LLAEVLEGSEESKAAARRHGRLVVKNIFSDAPKNVKQLAYKNAQKSFKKQILLMTEL
jgi:hypothetical protein